MQDLKQLAVWHKAHALFLACYRALGSKSADTPFWLRSQLLKAAASISANIAEGCGKRQSPVCRSVGWRYGLSVVELLTVMTIAGTLMAIAIPHGQRMLDRISVHSAAGDLMMTLASAREYAIASHSSVAVDFASPSGVRVRRGSEILFSRNIASAHGVQLSQTRDSMAYGPLGLGRGAANLSVVVRRREAAETVFVSRLGRVR